VRDHLEREANAKQAFVDILDIGVIEPLAAFKGTKDETKIKLRKISRNPPRGMLIMQRKISRSSKQHTSRNTTLGFVISRMVRENLRLRNLQMSPTMTSGRLLTFSTVID
jgi:hypothetical protein